MTVIDKITLFFTALGIVSAILIVWLFFWFDELEPGPIHPDDIPARWQEQFKEEKK